MNTTIIKGKSPLFSSFILGCVAGIALYGICIPQTINADVKKSANSVLHIEDDLLGLCRLAKYDYQVKKTIKMVITAYSSTEDQTDDTPLTTASNKMVFDGLVANNMLAFGTKVRIPSLFGDKVFTVDDRMHSRKGKYHVDVWFPEYSQAKEFGAKIANIEILES